VLRLLPNKPQFSLRFMLRLIVYSSLITLCLRLYQQTRPARRAEALLRATDSWTNSTPHGYLKAMGSAAIPYLLRELEYGDESQQVRAIEALQLLPAEADRVVPVLLTKLKHSDATVRRPALKCWRMRWGCERARNRYLWNSTPTTRSPRRKCFRNVGGRQIRRIRQSCS
jgi:hypothetical protein